MSGTERRLLLIFRGVPSQIQLDQLRQALDLSPSGRLTDSEDAHFGARDLVSAGTPAAMNLWRSDSDLWSVSIDAEYSAILADTDISLWQSSAEAAAAEAGFTLLERRSFKKRDDAIVPTD